MLLLLQLMTMVMMMLAGWEFCQRYHIRQAPAHMTDDKLSAVEHVISPRNKSSRHAELKSESMWLVCALAVHKKLDYLVMRISHRRPHYALLRVCLFVSPVRTLNLSSECSNLVAAFAVAPVLVSTTIPADEKSKVRVTRSRRHWQNKIVNQSETGRELISVLQSSIGCAQKCCHCAPSDLLVYFWGQNDLVKTTSSHMWVICHGYPILTADRSWHTAFTFIS